MQVSALRTASGRFLRSAGGGRVDSGAREMDVRVAAVSSSPALTQPSSTTWQLLRAASGQGRFHLRDSRGLYLCDAGDGSGHVVLAADHADEWVAEPAAATAAAEVSSCLVNGLSGNYLVARADGSVGLVGAAAARADPDTRFEPCATVVEGWLSKKSSGRLSGRWQLRFFVLADRKLSYWVAEKELKQQKKEAKGGPSRVLMR